MEMDRRRQKESRGRVTPFIRTDLSWSEGVRIDTGNRSLRIKALPAGQISVTEIVDGDIRLADKFPLSTGETYQHEFSEGKVICVLGGKTRGRKRDYTFLIPTDLKVTKIVHKTS